MNKTLIGIIALTFLLFFLLSSRAQIPSIYISHTCKAKYIRMHWKDESGNILGSIGNTLNYLRSKQQNVVMIMNGGMYLKDHSPQGLYIEHGKLIRKLNTKKSTYGNFYMSPNGVFYITKNKIAKISTTKELKSITDIEYATQSGPMLVIKSKINSKFLKGSKYLNIRNGVGILPNGDIIFAISKEEVSLYDFAYFFQEKGCENALYLDGFVSRMYLSNGEALQKDGNFGVIISTTK